jgi:hypothetical protein
MNGVEVTGFLKYVDKPTFYKGQLGFASTLLTNIRKYGAAAMERTVGALAQSQSV